MTGVVITVDDREVNDALAQIVAAGGNPTPALKNIGEHLATSTKKRIAAERSPDGSAFAPLNTEYAKIKKGPGILRGETRRLSEIVWQLAGEGVEVGSNAEYAAINHFGGTIRPKNAAALVFSLGGRMIAVKSVTIPGRPFLGVSADDRDEIMAILEDFFGDAAGAGGPE